MSSAQSAQQGMRIPKPLAIIAVSSLAALILFVANYVNTGKLTREADAKAVITKQLRFEDRSKALLLSFQRPTVR